jgi:hypothetical protein
MGERCELFEPAEDELATTFGNLVLLSASIDIEVVGLERQDFVVRNTP